ncbi:hypothetical protein IQ07DRAFT_592577 [Pyrenochaeta sp. DS3sAY3a]|nr:hypothetical protein IQ07DRAFT_592577 [Pyrenochaeta sp. DS3sAY3a]
MALDSLPRELLLMITDYLLPTTIESLALTFNKQITLTCLPLLQRLFARRRHAKRMASMFSADNCWRSSETIETIEQNREKLGIPATSKIGEPTESEYFTRLQYLEFKEDLHWLEPRDEKSAEIRAFSGYALVLPLEANQLDDLRAEADALGITIPPSFFKLFADKTLLNRLNIGRGCFAVDGGIRKVPAFIDNGNQGYSIRLSTTPLDFVHCSIYMESGNQRAHCMLGKLHDSMDEATANEEVYLEAYSFEEWLAMTYFNVWLWYVLNYYQEPEEPLREYVRRIYVRDE